MPAQLTTDHWPLATIPLVIAHRGASGLAPENTMAAFRLATALGADGFELDVQLSADGQPVVIHDARVNRTTGRSSAQRLILATTPRHPASAPPVNSETITASAGKSTVVFMMRGVRKAVSICG